MLLIFDTICYSNRSWTQAWYGMSWHGTPYLVQLFRRWVV